MELKNLKSLLTPQVDENWRHEPTRKSFEDSAEYDMVHGKINNLLKQVSMLIKSQQLQNWIEDTDENFGSDDDGVSGSELYDSLYDNIDATVKANDKLWDWMIHSGMR